ncbi:NAD(P)-dependent oxidoreductase [Polynucleobacter sp. MWH-Svant-W18]|uniref:NAD-dependent epimerase/dehydratase family protein n=1 Tax=Polynucleobacter sp. MWH-Svant-W18 TaxID=1855909 RepID=UPI001BFD627D|nr:NAD-dependent epimerase/dehydratase family protein [Polynucleobacter sp. MWH-Svant-W18]QWD78296.1 NAD-dependent epimerase/dehydratase family protein [Polynucleobacter sp. MWH-Svant-W18]
MQIKIVITGGAGFIGSQLAAKLVGLGGYEVVIIDNLADGHVDNLLNSRGLICPLVVKDVRSGGIADDINGADVVIHLAGTSSLPQCQVDPAFAYDNNVTGLANLLEISRRANVKRVIFSSTSAVYENNIKIPFSEMDHVHPNLIYASSKLAGEQLCKSFAETYGLDVVVARFFNIFGEHQDIHRAMPPFISYLAKEAYFGREPVLFNNSSSSRDYVYVDDVLECLMRMMGARTKFKGDIFNVCTGIAYSVPQIVALYSKISNKKIIPLYKDANQFWDKFPALFAADGLKLSRDRIEAEVYKNSVGDIQKTYDFFGFKASTTLEAGLKKVYEFSLANLAK